MCGCMTSCTDHTEFIGNVVQAKTEAFDEAFVEAYGEIQPGHDWGFGSVGQAARTRSADTNGNMWFTSDPNYNYKQVPPITDAELAKVLAVFNQTGAEKYTSLIDWDEYFVQQVYTGIAVYTDSADNTGILGSSKMNWLYSIDKDGNEDHINNFNHGSNNDYNGIMLMKNSSTKEFGFSNSNGQGRLFKNFRMEVIDGNYYVGFDFESWRSSEANANEGVKRDFIYNDWIVKIVPAERNNGETPTIPQVYVVVEETTPSAYYEVWTGKKVVDIGRVMAEDLGSSDLNDMDYNDVVFEARIVRPYTEIRKKDSESSSDYETVTNVTIDGTNYYAGEESAYANIKLLAAGGTIPIEVAGIDVHNAFGAIGKTTMINTENPNMTNGTYATCGPTDLQKDGGDKNFDYSSIDAIPISATFANNTVIIDNSGSVPHKICVPTSAPWPLERIEMNEAYSNKFGSGTNGSTGDGYVQDKSIKFWEFNVSGKVNNLEGFGQSIGNVFDEKEETYGTVEGQTSYSATLQDAVNTTYPTVESGWTTIWTRGADDGYLYNDGTEHNVHLYPTDFSTITKGSKLRIYGVYRDGFVIYSAIGNGSSSDYNQNGYIEFDLPTDSHVSQLSERGLTITGSNFTVTNVAIKVAAVEPTHVEATPGENETDLITSPVEFTGYSTEVIANSLFSDAKQYTILRIYGWATGESSNYSIQTGNNTGGFISETYCTQNSDVSMTTNGYIELQLTKAGASKLKELGLLLTGQNFKFSHITIDNSQIPVRETYASGSTISLFEGTKQQQHNWGEATIIVDKSYFSKAKAGDVIQITCSYWHDPNGSNDGKWRITLKGNADSYTFISPDPWYGGTDGYHTNDNNPSHFDATNGLMTFTLSETSVSILEDCGLNISFGGLSITSVDLIVP